MSTPKKEFVLTQVFENVEKLGPDDPVYSKTAQHFNANWRFFFYRSNDNFHLSIECLERTADTVVEGDIEFKLESKSGRSLILNRKISWGKPKLTKFLDWNTFMSQYVVDGKVTISATVTITKMVGFKKEDLRKFDESVKECSDLVLVVAGRKFYVSKMFLAFQSSHFKSQFLENSGNSEKSEIELNEIDPADFQNFLELLHGESSINDSTVEGILQLADMYDSPTALRRCAHFLLEESNISVGKKLELSSRYNLESLKKKCLSGVNSFHDVQSIVKYNMEQLDESILRSLLKKSIHFS